MANREDEGLTKYGTENNTIIRVQQAGGVQITFFFFFSLRQLRAATAKGHVVPRAGTASARFHGAALLSNLSTRRTDCTAFTVFSFLSLHSSSDLHCLV